MSPDLQVERLITDGIRLSPSPLRGGKMWWRITCRQSCQWRIDSGLLCCRQSLRRISNIYSRGQICHGDCDYQMGGRPSNLQPSWLRRRNHARFRKFWIQLEAAIGNMSDLPGERHLEIVSTEAPPQVYSTIEILTEGGWYSSSREPP